MTRRRRASVCAAAVLAVTPGAALAAPSGNIVFVRDGDLWRTSPATRQVQQITRDGTAASPYRSPSQADGGMVVALRGERLHGFTLGNELIGDVRIPASVTAGRRTVTKVAVAPSGDRVALVVERPCGETACRDVVTLAIRTNRVERETVLETPGDLTGLAWAGPARLVVTRSAGVTEFADGAAGAPLVGDATPGVILAEADVSAAGIALERRAPEGTTVRLFSPDPAGGAPVVRCDVTGPGVAHPTWGPGGDGLAWQTSMGVVATGTWAGACPQEATLLAPGGTQPDWGPASLPANPRPPAPPATGGTGGSGGGTGGTGGGTGGTGGGTGGTGGSAGGGGTGAGGGTAGGGGTPSGGVTVAPVGGGGATPTTIPNPVREVARLSVGPGLRLTMRLRVVGAVTVRVDRVVGRRRTHARTVRAPRRKGTVRISLAGLKPGTYRVLVRVAVRNGGTARLPALRLRVRRTR